MTESRRSADMAHVALDFGLARTSAVAAGLNYDATFKAMAVRRFNRRWYGKRGASALSAMTVYVLLISCAIVSAFYWRNTREVAVNDGNDSRVETYFEMPLSTLVACATCGFAFVLLQSCGFFHWLFRRLLYIYVLFLILQLIFIGFDSLQHELQMTFVQERQEVAPTRNNSNTSCTHHQAVASVFDVLWLLCWVGALGLYCMGRLYGRFARSGRFFFRDVKLSFNIRLLDTPRRRNGPRWRFAYRPVEPQGWHPPWPLSRWLGVDATFEYRGPVDPEGRPHGLGKWVDTQAHGETLKGYWEHGIPVGPFRSVETGSGYGCYCVRIGVATCSTELDPSATNMRPTCGPLRWGIAAVEASINGRFYHHLPAASVLRAPHEDDGSRDAKWVLGLLQHLNDTDDAPTSLTISVDPNSCSLSVSGHVALDEIVANKACVEIVDLPGSMSFPEAPAQAHTSERSENSLREDTMGDASTWMCSRPLLSLKVDGWQSYAASQGSRSSEAVIFVHGWQSPLQTAQVVLAQFLALASCPSYIKPFIFNWPCGGLFTYTQARDTGARSDATAASFVAFVRSLAEAGVIKLHLLLHSMGARVFSNALPTLLPMLRPKGVVTAPTAPCDESASKDTGVQQQIALTTCTFLHPDHELHSFVNSDFPLLRTCCEHITLYCDRHDLALAASELLYNHSPSLGKHPFALVHKLPSRPSGRIGRLRGYSKRRELELSRRQRPLEMDVIDISWLDTNINAVRHNFFNINRWLIDDLLEVITTHKRAVQRSSRLTHRGGNVWTFLAAPKNIANE